MGLSENPVAIVVSPLVALMEKQVREVHIGAEIHKDGNTLSQTSSQLISAAPAGLFTVALCKPTSHVSFTLISFPSFLSDSR